MPSQITYHSEGFAGGPVLCQARIVAPDATGTAVANEGNAVQAADVASITCTIYDASSPQPSLAIAAPTITTASITALTADNQWSRLQQPIDAIGRNLYFNCPGTALVVPGHTYWIVFKVTLSGTNGSTLYIIFEHHINAATPG